jgi:hypothetical protein|tara:strand:+ start:74 stop:442 length:369 start_codon:yes stop_codon:yes gene_type:complete
MKLELKHLAPYLPYQVKSVHYFKGHELIKEIDCANVYGFVNGDTLHKPILRPLSDLELFIGILTNGNEQHSEDLTLYFNGVHAIFMTMEKVEILRNFLLKNHFDVFGLIEAGLAIDINTLND